MNNFDQSSTGVNIEFIHFFDTSMAYDYFKTDIERIKNNIYMYIGGGEYNKNSYLPTIKRPDDKKLELLQKQLIKEDGDRYDDLALDDVWEQFLDDLYEYDWIDPKDESEFYVILEKYGIEYTLNHSIIYSYGYSQGDIAIVVVPYGKDNDKGFRDYIGHLFWDTPYYGVLNVNNKEYYLCDYLEDCYDISEDDVVDVLRKIGEELSEKEREVLETFIENNSFKISYH